MSIDKLANAMVEAGYEVAFGITGSGKSYSLIKALVDRGIKFFPVSNEMAAAVAAGSYSYHNRKKALSISIKGPGFANMVAGIAACYLERFNLLAISEEYDDSTSPSNRHKRFDQQIMLKEITTKRVSMRDKELVEFFHDDEGLPGPKYLSLSELALEKSPQPPTETALGEERFEQILDKIEQSQKPLIIIGSLIYRLGWEELIIGINIPIMTSVQAKGSFNEFTVNSFGIYTGVGLSAVPENELVSTADLIITVGLRNEELLDPSDKARFINIDLHPADYDKYTLACSKRQIKSIIESIKMKSNWSLTLKEKYDKTRTNYIQGHPWLPAKVFQIINSIPDPFSVVLDTGFFCTVGEHVILANSNRRFIGSSNGRNMGLSVPMAFGVSLNHKPVFCCFGDGGIRYHIGEIRSIIETRLPVCFILFTDGQYGSVSSYIGLEHWVPELTKPLGTTWVPVMASLGIPAYLVENETSLSNALDEWNHLTPIYIEAKFNPIEYSTMTTTLRK